jgi:glycosyltransferase involved in cell wall biosynthesis
VSDRALHIGIDARELSGKPTGVGRYLAGLLGAWSAEGFLHRVSLFSPIPIASADVTRFENVVVPAENGGTWWEQMRLPEAARRAGVDVWFSPGYTAPLRLRAPLVVAIHDVSFFAHPEWFSWREGLRRRWLSRAAARKARSVVTISQFSADEITRWLGVPPARIALAPPGVASIASVAPDAAAPVGDPMVLFVGSLFNRRHIPELLTAFALVAGRVPNARLVLAGDNRVNPPIDPRAMAAAHGVGGRVEWKEYVSDVELARLYGQARVFVFLSEYEGFAMTPLEALARGVPSVLLDVPVAREVYGPAARLVPLDPAVIADAIVDLLLTEGARRQVLDEGERLLRTHTWPRAAATVLETLERAAS